MTSWGQIVVSSGDGSSGFDLADLVILRVGLVATGRTGSWQAGFDGLQYHTERGHLLCGLLRSRKQRYIEGSLVR